MKREQQTLVGGVNRELCCHGVQGMRREQQILVGGLNRELHCQGSARDEERAANTGRRIEQRVALPRECKG